MAYMVACLGNGSCLYCSTLEHHQSLPSLAACLPLLEAANMIRQSICNSYKLLNEINCITTMF